MSDPAGEGFQIATAFIQLTASSDGLEAEIQEKLDAAVEGLSATVLVNADIAEELSGNLDAALSGLASQVESAMGDVGTLGGDALTSGLEAATAHSGQIAGTAIGEGLAEGVDGAIPGIDAEIVDAMEQAGHAGSAALSDGLAGAHLAVGGDLSDNIGRQVTDGLSSGVEAAAASGGMGAAISRVMEAAVGAGGAAQAGGLAGAEFAQSLGDSAASTARSSLKGLSDALEAAGADKAREAGATVGSDFALAVSDGAGNGLRGTDMRSFGDALEAAGTDVANEKGDAVGTAFGRALVTGATQAAAPGIADLTAVISEQLRTGLDEAAQANAAVLKQRMAQAGTESGAALADGAEPGIRKFEQDVASAVEAVSAAIVQTESEMAAAAAADDALWQQLESKIGAARAAAYMTVRAGMAMTDEESAEFTAEELNRLQALIAKTEQWGQALVDAQVLAGGLSGSVATTAPGSVAPKSTLTEDPFVPDPSSDNSGAWIRQSKLDAQAAAAAAAVEFSEDLSAGVASEMAGKSLLPAQAAEKTIQEMRDEGDAAITAYAEGLDTGLPAVAAHLQALDDMLLADATGFAERMAAEAAAFAQTQAAEAAASGEEIGAVLGESLATGADRTGEQLPGLFRRILQQVAAVFDTGDLTASADLLWERLAEDSAVSADSIPGFWAKAIRSIMEYFGSGLADESAAQFGERLDEVLTTRAEIAGTNAGTALREGFVTASNGIVADADRLSAQLEASFTADDALLETLTANLGAPMARAFMDIRSGIDASTEDLSRMTVQGVIALEQLTEKANQYGMAVAEAAAAELSFPPIPATGFGPIKDQLAEVAAEEDTVAASAATAAESMGGLGGMMSGPMMMGMMGATMVLPTVAGWLDTMSGVGDHTAIDMYALGSSMLEANSATNQLQPNVIQLATAMAVASEAAGHALTGLTNVDQSLANLYATNPTLAAAEFDQMSKSMLAAGLSTQQIAADFPMYTGAVQQATIAAKAQQVEIAQLVPGTEAFSAAVAAQTSTLQLNNAQQLVSATAMNNSLPPQARLSDAAVTAANAYSQASTATNSYTQSLNALYGRYGDASAAQAALTTGLAGLTGQITHGTNAVDLNSAAGAKNYTAFYQVAQEAETYAQKLYEQTGNTTLANQSLQTSATRLDQAATAAHLTTAQVQQLNTELYGVPDVKDITLDADTAQASGAISNLQKQIGGLSQSFTINVNGSNVHVSTHAKGGPVKAGEMSLVGEEGPEIVTFGADGFVTPNDRIPVVGGGVGVGSSGGGGGGGGNSYTFGPTYVQGILPDLSNPNALSQGARQFVWQLRNALKAVDGQYGVRT